MTELKKVPGAGSYPVPSTINERGKYFLSKFRSSGATTFNPPRSKRFPEEAKSQAPGPGMYDIKTGIKPDGSYYITGF